MEAFINHIAKKRSALLSFISGYTSDYDEAKDVFQESCLKAMAAIERGQFDNDNLTAWFGMICRNSCIDYIRRNNKRAKVIVTENNVSDIVDTDTNKFSEELLEKLEGLISKLCPDQREVIVLHYYANMKFKDIAIIKGKSINTILGQSRYALTNIRKMIKAENINLYE